MKLTVSTLLLASILALSSAAPSFAQRDLAGSPALAARIERELRHNVIRIDTDIRTLSLGQMKAIQDVLRDDESTGQKRGRIQAIIRNN